MMAWTSSPPGLCQIDISHRKAAACKTLFALNTELVIHPLIRQVFMPLPNIAVHGPAAVPASAASKDCQTQARAPNTGHLTKCQARELTALVWRA